MPQRTHQPTSRAASAPRRPRSPPGGAPLPLPAPRHTGGTSLSAALRRRRTVREISGRKLPRQLLADLLWAACGVNRRRGPFGTPGITAASASNSQEIELLVALEHGVYRYDPRHHELAPIVAGDLRPLAIGRGQKAMVTDAPVQIIYVADIRRLTHSSGFQEPGLHDPEIQKSYYYVDTGLIAENVYLFAASQGLACWFHNCDRTGLTRRLKLRAEQRVLFAQTVGFPERRG